MGRVPGIRLGAYEIVGLLGAGGMGEVYRARDTKLNRDVALKILPDAFTHDPDRVFVHEDAELLELFAKHAAIAITNARLHEAAESEARAEAAAAERNRMAREVHDTVAQGLVSVLLQIRGAQGSIAVGRPD